MPYPEGLIEGRLMFVCLFVCMHACMYVWYICLVRMSVVGCKDDENERMCQPSGTMQCSAATVGYVLSAPNGEQ